MTRGIELKAKVTPQFPLLNIDQIVIGQNRDGELLGKTVVQVTDSEAEITTNWTCDIPLSSVYQQSLLTAQNIIDFSCLTNGEFRRLDCVEYRDQV